MRIPEDQGSHGGIPNADNVLRRRDHLQKVPFFNSQVGRRRGCRQETLGAYRCLSFKLTSHVIAGILYPFSVILIYRVNLRPSANTPKRSIPTRSITRR